jgi:hypothetical protein
VHFREQNFEWQPVAGQAGVSTKHIGSFTEKGVAVFFVQLEAGARHTLAAAPQTQLVFVKHGTGTFGNGEPWFQHTAVQVAAGESAAMSATSLTQAVVLQLPRL